MALNLGVNNMTHIFLSEKTLHGKMFLETLYFFFFFLFCKFNSNDFLNGIFKFWFTVIRINAKDIISNDESKSKLWWGPFPFVFDNVTFYQLVYKKTDIDAPWNEVCIIFCYRLKGISSNPSEYLKVAPNFCFWN